MAEPERQANQLQPLTAEAEGKIGSFYLSNLLKTIRYCNLKSSSFLALGEFSEKIGVKIPADLFNGHFNSLSWIPCCYKESLPKLFLGKDADNYTYIDNDFNQALATIEIARSADSSDGKSKEKYTPLFLRIAGVDKEQNRIIAATYDLEDQNHLIEFNVSLGLNEHFRASPLINAPRLLTLLPSNDKKPYETAALVTKGMVNVVKKLDDSRLNTDGILPLMEAAVFSRTSEGFSHGKNLMYVDLKRISDYTSKLGYYIKEESEIVTVGLTQEAARERKTNSWEISLPKFLSKA